MNAFQSATGFLSDRFTGRNAGNFETRDRICTRANLLTMSGIAAVIFYVIQFTQHVFVWWIPITCVFVCISDALDGWLADHYNEHSVYGKVLDPLRDRIFTLALLLNVWLLGKMTILLPFAVTVVIEGLLFAEGVYFYRKYHRVANVHCVGKLRSLVQWVATLAIVVEAYWFSQYYIPLTPLVWVIAIASITAFVFYNVLFRSRSK